MIFRSANFGTFTFGHLIDQVVLCRPSPNIQGSFPLCWKWKTLTQLTDSLAVVAIITGTYLPYDRPYNLSEVHHVKIFTEVSFSVGIPDSGIDDGPDKNNWNIHLGFQFSLKMLWIAKT